MSRLGERLREVEARIEGAARRAGRDPREVRLVAVSKTFPAAAICEAVAAGARALGENRVQEATAKIPEVRAATSASIEWHLVGALQRNKTRKAVELFDVIHSVDRIVLARAIDQAAAALGRRPRVLLQVNVDAEPQKAGAVPSELGSLLAAVLELPQLHPVGLMAIPRVKPEAEAMRPAFARLRSLLGELKLKHPEAESFRELSMGMSADFEVAIEEGATWVRIGTAIFGERSRP